MTRMTLRLALLAAALVLAACGQATARSPDAAIVALVGRPDISADVRALPHLTGDGDGPARVNALLEAIDAADRAAHADCAGWRRTVSLPMTGPSYLTVKIDQDLTCGGTFEGVEQVGLTFDVAEGGRLDWAAAIPNWRLSAGGDDRRGIWASPVLADWYSRRILTTYETDWVEMCRDRFGSEAQPGMRFDIWLDAEQPGLVVFGILPAGQPDCFSSVSLGPDEMQTLGIAPEITAALLAAHEAKNWSLEATAPATQENQP